MIPILEILEGDCLDKLRSLPAESVHCCVTSPPYWGLRDYGVAGQLGLEKTPEEYVAKMVTVFREVRRVLRDDGTCWVNLGDSYAGAGYSNHKNTGGCNREDGGKQHHTRPGSGRADGIVKTDSPRNRDGLGAVPGLKPKDLVGIPWRVAFALQADGWWLRSDIIWHKPNPMPESVTDRPTKSHEYIFLLAKTERYFYDAEAIKELVEESQIGRVRNDTVGGSSWKERQQHGIGGQYDTRKTKKVQSIRLLFGESSEEETSGGGTNGRDVALPGEHRIGERRERKSGTPLCKGAEMARQDERIDGRIESLRNKRSVWTVATSPYAEAHFATFPPDLIKPCILAGTSARGCCPKCGARWERVVENSPMEISRSERTHELGRTRASGTMTKPAESKTIGWEAGCDCCYPNSDGEPCIPQPCTVLDPFAGSGTTGQAALELGRSAVLIELNPKYVELIKRRTHVTPGLAL